MYMCVFLQRSILYVCTEEYIHTFIRICVYVAGTVTLIDYEYAGVNYPAFDVGSFFCEFGGNDANIHVYLSLHSVPVLHCIYCYRYMWISGLQQVSQ